MKRAATPRRVWSIVERVSFWGLVLLTGAAVGYLDRTPLARAPWLADLVVLALWTGRVGIVGWRRHGWRAFAAPGVAVAALGGFGVVTGLWLDPLWSPTFTVAPVEASMIVDLSRFRSCAGEDDSGPAVGSPGQHESDRSMKHSFVIDGLADEGSEVVVRAMADGLVSAVTADDQLPGRGGDVTLTMSGFSQLGHWDLRYVHVVPSLPPGSRVRAGDVIGVLPPADGDEERDLADSTAVSPTRPLQFDLVLGYHPLVPFGEQLDSFMAHLDPGLALVLGDSGFTVEEAVIPRAERDAQPCAGTYDATPDSDWIFGDRVRRAADDADAREGQQSDTGEPVDEFALRPTCTVAVVATKWMSDAGVLWTCVLDEAGVPMWQLD